MNNQDPNKPTGAFGSNNAPNDTPSSSSYSTGTGSSVSSGSTTSTTTTPADLQARATDDIKHVGEKAKQEFDAAAHKVSEDVRDLKTQAGEKLGEVAEQAKSFATDQKGFAATQINGVASAITKVADELDGTDQATVARYARDLASGISSMGKTIEERNVDDLMTMAQDFGRRQPLAFLGVAALAGFVASRFAMASSHRSTASTPSSTNKSAGLSGEDSSYQPQSGSSYAPRTSDQIGGGI
jgi:ElaB/YqjD/DUF883 family membrane-anchored ribosome-binding protein